MTREKQIKPYSLQNFFDKDAKIYEILDPGMLEYPFVREDMTLAEYEIEMEYWGTHLEEVMAGEYKPLWKQKTVHEAEPVRSEKTGQTSKSEKGLGSCQSENYGGAC